MSLFLYCTLVTVVVYRPGDHRGKWALGVGVEEMLTFIIGCVLRTARSLTMIVFFLIQLNSDSSTVSLSEAKLLLQGEDDLILLV